MLLWLAGAFLQVAVSDNLAKPPTDYDILIKGGKLYDGSPKPAFRADIAIKKEKIVKQRIRL